MSLTLRQNDLYHPDYTANIEKWALICDVVDGKEAIDVKGETYLPRPIGRTDDEYTAYQTRAVLYNATVRTLDGLLGGIFRKELTAKVPKELEYILDDTDGEGSDIQQFSKKITKFVLSYGRAGILVDYPIADGVYTLADERAANLKARIHAYSPQTIVNWNVVRDGGLLKLTHVMLEEESTRVAGHAFMREKFTRYRLLELDEDGLYVIRIMEKTETIDPKTKVKSYDWVEAETIKPRLPNGKRLDYIPFKFVGSITNTSDIDKAPLYDLSVLNLAHYRNSADYEEALFMLGQPTPWITGLSDDFITSNQGQLRIGSRAAWLLPENSEVGLLESKSEKNLLQKGMELKEAEMIGLGARLVQDNSSRGSESEASVLLRRSGESSIMACISDNVSKAIFDALTWVSVWMGVNPEPIKFKLSSDFFATRITHQEITALVAAWQSGVIPKAVIYDNLRRGEVINQLLSDEELDDMIEEEAPNLNMIGNNIIDDVEDEAIDARTRPNSEAPDRPREV